jgi:hypothetical protein
MAKKSESHREWVARVRAQSERERRAENDQAQAHILRLEGLTTAELQQQAAAAWEDYREKHLALGGGDDVQIRALEKVGASCPLASKQVDDAIDLARILAVIWQRGETWSPEEPVFLPREK